MRDYKDMIDLEKELVRSMYSKRDYLVGWIVHDSQIQILRYIIRLRRSEFFYNKYKTAKNKLSKLLYAAIWLILRRHRNKLGNMIGVDIRENSVGKGLHIYHSDIVVNGHAIIGENCKLHGNNCIGNDGKSGACPKIGNNVDVGYGAIIIGDIFIADNVKIAAGAVVIKSFEKEGSTVGGVPGKLLK